MYGSTTPKLTERDTDCGRWMLLYPSGMMIYLMCFFTLVLDLGWNVKIKSERTLSFLTRFGLWRGGEGKFKRSWESTHHLFVLDSSEVLHERCREAGPARADALRHNQSGLIRLDSTRLTRLDSLDSDKKSRVTHSTRVELVEGQGPRAPAAARAAARGGGG